jgi:hypothetical protein
LPLRPGVLPFALIACLTVASPARAQDEFLVNDDRVNKNQWAPTVACGSSGSLVVVWMDGRNTFNGNVDFDTYALTLHDPHGIGSSLNRRLNDDVGGGQSFPDVAASPSGTFFCVWEDTRASNRDIYGTALDSIGLRITPNLRLNDDVGSFDQSHPAVAAVGTDRYLVVWADQRQAQGEIFGVYVTASGAPIGPNFKISVDPVTGGSFQGEPALAAMPDGSVLVAWRDGRGGAVVGATEDIYAQRFNALGQPVGVNFKVNATTGNQDDESVCVAADPVGYVVGWIDRRNKPADTGDVYAQRIDPSGGVVGGNVRVNDDPTGRDQRAVRAIATPGAAYLLWEDYRGNLGIDANVQAARVPYDTAPPGVNFRVNAFLPARQGTPDAVWDGRDGIVAVWEDGRNGSPDVYALSILPDGTRRNSETQLNDDAASGDQRRPRVGRGPGQYIASWIDWRSGTGDLFGQWIAASGGRSGANHLIAKDDGVNRPVTASSTVTASGQALVAAQLARDSDAGEIRGFLYTATGSPPASSFWISDGLASAQSSPAATTDGGSFATAWLDARTGTTQPYGQLLTLAGARVGENHPILTSPPSLPVVALDLDKDRTNGYWLAYAIDGVQPGLWIVHLDSGLRQDRPPVEVGAGQTGTRSEPHLGVGSEGRIEVAWLCSDPVGLTRVYVQGFDTSGAALTNAMRIDPGHDDAMLAPGIAVSGGQSVVTWESKRGDDWIPWLQAFEGGVAPSTGVLRADQDVLGADQLDPSAGLDASGRVVVLWSDGRSISSGSDIVGRVFAITPTPVKEPPGPPPTPEPAPAAFRIGPASPNPFSGALAIPIERPGALGRRLLVRVVNARGERVATIYDGPMGSDRTVVRWDGRDVRSRQAGSGVYWIVAESGGERRAVRVVQLR